MIPYGRHWVTEEDVAAVAEVLRSDWLTTGPVVERFEEALARQAGVGHAVAMSSGTAALHAAMFALGIEPGDEVIVPAMTFSATANAVVYQGGTPVFADVEPGTLQIDPACVGALVSPRTRAIVAVDYAGQPCDYEALRAVANRHGSALVADACHALGATYRGRPVGSLADISVFSFHPVKAVTTGEGGTAATDDGALADRMRRFRNHGLSADHRTRAEQGTWHYDMVELGYNYRLTDFQCALGLSQLRRLPSWIQRRQEVAREYDRAVEGTAIRPLTRRDETTHACHLYVARARDEAARADLFAALRTAGVGVNVHYRPVHLHSFYRQRFGTRPGLCPEAEAAYQRILSLPIFPAITEEEIVRVIEAVGQHGGCA